MVGVEDNTAFFVLLNSLLTEFLPYFQIKLVGVEDNPAFFVLLNSLLTFR